MLALLPVDDRLLLVLVLAGEEVAVAPVFRRIDLIVVEHLGKPRGQRVAAGQLGQVGPRIAVLGLHPILDLGPGRIFEPAIRIVDGGAVELLDDVFATGRWVVAGGHGGWGVRRRGHRRGCRNIGRRRGGRR